MAADSLPVVDMSDKNAWDDSYLTKNWADTLKEYEKYHSIHKSGKRLEDVLSKEELDELRQEYGDLIEDTDRVSATAQEVSTQADQTDSEMANTQTNGVEQSSQAEAEKQELKTSGLQEPTQPASAEDPATHDGAFGSAMPQAILGTVQDKNLKNLMMSWYYAGYYTGFHDGQQQAQNGNQPKE